MSNDHGEATTASNERSPTSRPGGRSSSSTTPTARTRVTSIFAASKSTPALLAFLSGTTSGVVCAPMDGDDAGSVAMPLMTPHNRERCGPRTRSRSTPAPVSRPGISAADRAHTIRVLADSATEPRAGPARARVPAALPRGRRARPCRPHRGGGRPRPAGRTDARRGHRRAGQRRRLDASWAVSCAAFADEHGLALIRIADLDPVPPDARAAGRSGSPRPRLPTPHGTFRAYGYRNLIDGSEHIALVLRDGGRPGARCSPGCTRSA